MSSKKITAYLPPDMISSIKMEAAQKGIMRFSEIISFKLYDAFYYFKSTPNYMDLEKKFKKVLSQFVPSRVGRPWSRESIPKVGVTLFLSGTLNREIASYAKKYSLSKSSLIELSIRIANKDLNNGIPLFIKITEEDKLLLNKLMLKTGAASVSEFLTACDFKLVLDEIRERIGSLDYK
jgi:hypothetical protein